METDGRELKSGLYYLETYIVPGYVFYMEFEQQDGRKLKPILSPQLKEHPELLLRLKDEIGGLTEFVRELKNGEGVEPVPGTGEPLYGAVDPESTFIFLLGGFKRGFLTFLRDESGKPFIQGEEAFTAAFSNAKELLRAFIDRINGYGKEDETIGLFNGGWDDENSEFTFTFLDPPEDEESRLEKEETVRENAELALQKMKELLKDLARNRKDREENEA